MPVFIASSRTTWCRALPAAAIAVASLWAPARVSAQDAYPVRPVRFIAPFPPGGPTDVLARTIAAKLAEFWGQQVVTDNRPGAAGNIGMEIAARAAPDGYTIVMGTVATHAINAALHPKLPYAPFRDFVPVALAAQTPSAFVLHPAVPAPNFAAFVALARTRGEALNYAHAGLGTLGHLAIELFRMQSGVRVNSVPYKGTAPALNDTIAGQVAFMITSTLTAMPHLRNGRLRAIAVTSAKRSIALPELPTVAESGLPDYVVVGWAGVFAPAGMRASRVARLNTDVNRALAAPDARERLLASGSEPAAMTADGFGAFARAEAGRWEKVVRNAGAKLE